MPPFVVRSSKYRHVFGTPSRKDGCFDNLKISNNPHDSNVVKVNPRFVAVNWAASGGGAFAVMPVDKPGKMNTNIPLFNGHTATVLDTEFHPFNDYVIASASEDCKIMIWNIPEGGLIENVSTPALTLSGHGRKVGELSFNPVAENILASSSYDFSLKLWDVSKGKEVVTIAHPDAIQNIAWNYGGSLIATVCRDKRIRLIDLRANKIVHENECHAGVKNMRLTWLGNGTKLATTGFSKLSDRQLAVWDVTNGFSSPLKIENLDTSSGLLMPFYDSDTKVLYLAGKGDGNIRYYEIVEEEPFFHYLSEYKSSEPQRGMAFLPKRSLNVSENEVARAFKVTHTSIEPISFKVPRKSDIFQADLFPDAFSGESSLSAEEWLSGKNANPKLCSLETGFVAPERKEFIAPAIIAAPSHHSEHSAEDELIRLRARVAELEKQIAEMRNCHN